MNWLISKNRTALAVAALFALGACRSSLPGAPAESRLGEVPAQPSVPAPLPSEHGAAPEPLAGMSATESPVLLAVGEPDTPIAGEPVLPTIPRDVSPPPRASTVDDSLHSPRERASEPEGNTQPLCRQRTTAFAIVVPGAGGSDPVGMFRRHLGTVERLGGQFVFLPPSVVVGDGGDLTAGQTELGIARQDSAVPVVLGPDLWEEGRRGCVLLVEDETTRVIALASPPNGRLQGARLLRSVLPKLGALIREDGAKAVILIADRPLWEADVTTWRRVRALLREVEDVSLVAFAGSGEFYWSEIDGIRCFRVPGTVLADGDFPGLLWVSTAAGRPRFSIVHGDDATGLAQFRQDVRMKREQLKGSLHASPIVDSRSTTSVTCRNPTPGSLQFRAKWVFGGSVEATVQPEILGFRLTSGEVFTQDFRIQAPGLPIKHLQPTLVLSTELPGGTGDPVPLEMRTSPWCCVFGEIRPVNAAPVLDGNPAEWGGPGFRINHASQIVVGADAWAGPADLSAHIFLGHDNSAVYLGALVYDDSLAQPAEPDGMCRAEFYVDLRSRPPGSDTDIPPGPGDLLKIVVAADGSSAVIPEGEDVRVVVIQGKASFSVEAVVGADRFADGELPPVIRMDAGLYDRSDPVQARKVLFLSGTPEDAMRGELMGSFTRVASGT